MGVEKRVVGGIPARASIGFRPGIDPAQRRRSIGTDRLTDAACKAARPSSTIRKLSDGKGLYLAIMPTGAKLWRMKYRHGGKESVYSIGPYDEITLAGARKARDEARDWLRDGKDPVAERRAAKATASVQQENTFAAVAEEWLAKQTYTPAHLAAQRKRLDDDLLPALGALPVAEITPAQVLEVLRRFERRGALEMGAKWSSTSSLCFRSTLLSSH